MRILLLAERPNLESAGQKRRLSIKTAARAYPAATVRYFINSKMESIKKMTCHLTQFQRLRQPATALNAWPPAREHPAPG